MQEFHLKDNFQVQPNYLLYYLYRFSSAPAGYQRQGKSFSRIQTHLSVGDIPPEELHMSTLRISVFPAIPYLHHSWNEL